MRKIKIIWIVTLIIVIINVYSYISYISYAFEENQITKDNSKSTFSETDEQIDKNKQQNSKDENIKNEENKEELTTNKEQINEEEEINDNKLKQTMQNNNQRTIETNNADNLIKTLVDGIYTISSAMNPNLVLDIAENSWNSGANAEIWQKNNGNNQRFRVTYLDGGYYTLEVISSGKYLSYASKTAKAGDNVIQSTYNKTDNQKWIIKNAGNGYYYIVSKESSLYLDVYGANATNGANVQLYYGNNGLNQKFKFNKVNTVSGSRLINDGTYLISTKMDFNRVLDVHGASYTNHANVELFSRSSSSNQKYQLEYDGQGYYKIVAVHSKKVLTVKEALTGAGANVEQYEDLGIDAQKWAIKNAGEGYYYIVSKCNGLYLDLCGGVSNSGTNVEVYDANYNNWQKFKFYPIDTNPKKTIEEGNYLITSSLNANKVIDIESDVITNNANIELWQNNGGNNQKFIITYLKDGYYTLKAFNSNKVLTVQDSASFNGTNVIQSYYNNLDSQKWSIQSAENGYYYIVSKLNGLVIDIEGANSKNGANVEVYEKNGGKNQKFKFVKTQFSSTVSNGKYAILASSNVNKVLDIENASINNGANVELFDSNGGTNQSFYFEYIGEGYYTIKAANSKKVLTAKGSNVIQQEYTNLDTQKWVVSQSDKNGYYAIRLAQTNNYLDIYNNNMYNGTNIEIYLGNESNAQKFKLEELVYKGIDVSKYQNEINWKDVSTQIDFTMIRIGYRGYGDTGNIVKDPYYNQNIEQAISNNVKCGVYFFTQAKDENEGIQEANWVLDNIKGYNIKYPIAIDTEWANGNKSGRADSISKESRTQAIKAFCETIRKRGYTPIIYASKDWLKNQLDMNQLSGYDVWLAHYVTGAPEKKSDYQGSYSMWQYTSQGAITGISGNVDVDICYKKYN